MYRGLPMLLTCLALAVPTPCDAAPTTPPVAVLVEPGMVTFGGMPALPPDKVVALLAEQGMAARAMTVDELLAEGLDPATTPVLVLGYGNAFPLDLLEPVRAYAAAGGALVLNGVPFCHPCERRDGAWVDLGGIEHFGHGAKGTGTGGFSGPATGVLTFEQHGFRENPLGLTDSTMLPAQPVHLQWLDLGSLPPEDEVIPLVGLLPEGEETAKPVSAIIRHRCGPFAGALNVWLGQAADGMHEEASFLAKQLMARAVGWCLADRGRLTREEFQALLSRLDALARPEPFPEALPVTAAPRPWGDTYLPKSPPPADEVFLVDARGLAPEERTALACLQGLTARTSPCLWIHMSDRDVPWLALHRDEGHFEKVTPVEDWAGLFTRFGEAYAGAVIPDAALYRGNLLAANVAACEDLIIATPELAERLGIPVKVDLRGRFDRYVDGMRWVWDTYGDRLSHHLCDFIHPDRLANGAFAYDLQWRAVMFWIVGPVDAAKPGSDMFAETRLAAEIMANLAPNTAVLGFPYAGHGVGPGEVNGVTLASKYAKPLVCTDSLANASLMSGVRIDRLTQPRPALPKLEKDKIYIALTMSDGDNQNTWLAFFRPFFEHPRKGEVPLAFGMGPPILDLMPAVAQWYFEQAPENTEFFADVSGIGYIQPENFGLAYADRAAAVRGFLDWTGKYLGRMDMGTLRTVGGEDAILSEFINGLPDIYGVMADMGAYHGRGGIENLTYTLEGRPVFRAVTSWARGRDGVIEELRENPGPARPAFVNGFVHCWTFPTLDAVLESIYAQRDEDMVFVTPRQLTALYEQARARGWVK